MKKRSSIIFLLLFSLAFDFHLSAQVQIVFTSTDGNNNYQFWRVFTNQPFVYENLSHKLDSIAPLAGEDVGPITISHDGYWFTFLSERFDPDAQGWAALTIVKSDFSQYETVRTHSGNLIHSEGKSFVFNGGTRLVFVSDNGNHARDIFVLQKEKGQWGEPVNITSTSTYEYNYCPYVSMVGYTVLFDAGHESFPSTAIGEANVDGSGVHFPITADSMPGGIATHSPCYDNIGNIIYEGDAEATGESIWELPYNSTTPYLITSAFPDDNSPVTLINGQIASLWIPDSWHQIKVMYNDGSGGILLTDSSALFTEVFDIGISGAPANPEGIHESHAAASKVKIFPNPSAGYFTITINNGQQDIGRPEIFTLQGVKVSGYDCTHNKNIIAVSGLSRGLYFVKFKFTKRSQIVIVQ